MGLDGGAWEAKCLSGSLSRRGCFLPPAQHGHDEGWGSSPDFSAPAHLELVSVWSPFPGSGDGPH